jgi:peptidoglycan hydrolase CwlO-like protein
MSEANQLINKLEQGVDALIVKVAHLNAVVKRQETEILELSDLNENFKTENARLDERFEAMQLKLQNSDSDKMGQYKSKISELVNEIDSCISLLNG